jgi:hypothetical protein
MTDDVVAIVLVDAVLDGAAVDDALLDDVPDPPSLLQPARANAQSAAARTADDEGRAEEEAGRWAKRRWSAVR